MAEKWVHKAIVQHYLGQLAACPILSRSEVCTSTLSVQEFDR